MDQKAKLKESLLKATDLHNLHKSKEYQSTLLPVFQQLSRVQPLDPGNYKSREDFTREVEIAFAKASVYADIIRLLEQQESAMNQFSKQIEAPGKDWAGGN